MASARIKTDPTRMGGLPTVRDTRVTVGMVAGQLAGGRTVDEVLGDYPYLDRDEVSAAAKYAAERLLGAGGDWRRRVDQIVDRVVDLP